MYAINKFNDLLKLFSDLTRQYFVNVDDTVAQRVNDLYWFFFPIYCYYDNDFFTDLFFL